MSGLFGRQQRFQFFLIAGELTNTFSQFFSGHGIFVGRPAELALGQALTRFTRIARRKFLLQRASVFSQLLEQLGADGQAITARQLFDLVQIAEAGTHHDGLEVVGLVVVVDARHGLHTGIVCADIIGARRLLVPVVDAAHERRDQKHARFSASNGLGEGKQQRQVGLNTVLLELLGSTNTFPGRGQLDQYPIATDACSIVETDNALTALDQRVGVERQACVYLSGHATRYNLENLLADGNCKAVAGQTDVALGTAERVGKHLSVAFARSGLEQQGRVGRGVLRLEAFDGAEIAGIGNNSGEFLELIQLGSHERALSCAVG
ncbi:Uncharacterized protein ALO72_05008 [Pseudomonas syringae pv. delphinii]|nr:Uncharacterized protein ALO72_05008 [Pseudomonas syringae pv. delphinii]